MLSKNMIKLYNSLKLRKYRKKYSLFLAEGEKIVSDLLNSGYKVESVIIEKTNKSFKDFMGIKDLIYASGSDIKKISNLTSSPDIIGVFKIPDAKFDYSTIEKGLILFLDDIRNPGNFGTIIRTANWFGIKQIFCTNETVDLYNPKVIQSTMGAISGVDIHYFDPDDIFPILKQNHNIYGTYLEGSNIYETEPDKNAVIVIGNEGKGISERVSKYVDLKISIPNFASGNYIPESLNASIATAIICSEFRRKLK